MCNNLLDNEETEESSINNQEFNVWGEVYGPIIALLTFLLLLGLRIFL